MSLPLGTSDNSSPLEGGVRRVAVKWFPESRKPRDACEWQRIIDEIIDYGFVDLVQQADAWRVTLATAGTPSGGAGQSAPVRDMRAEVIGALKAAGKLVASDAPPSPTLPLLASE
jgi:hypothetical protein